MRSRYGRLIVLVLLLALGMLIAALHNRAVEDNRPSIVATTVRAVLSPFQSAVHSVVKTGHNAKRSVRGRSRVMRENDNLRIELKQLTKENARLREEHAENIRLRKLLEFKKSYPTQLLTAQVIAMRPSQWHNTCTIDRGWRDGVRKTDPVITARGVVGQVIDVGSNVSQVLLLTDQASGLGAIVERSRVTGICQGQQARTLVLNYLDKDADVKKDDLVVTSGIGQVYPKGLRLGRVVKLRGAGGYMKSAEIRPSVQFDQLEEVAVIVRKAES
ncbi:MAG: rod shape-determining protein MreC [Armatimonadota bacterium]|nr:rod shape-determining protein MreC [Armatimonadota bacterium]